MTKHEILEYLNDIIIEENGTRVVITDNYSSSNLDNIAIVYLYTILKDKFNLHKVLSFKEYIKKRKTITIKELIEICYVNQHI